MSLSLASPSLDDLRWHPFQVDGKRNPDLKAQLADAAGVYAIRRKDSGGVVYVGESRTGQMWKTLSRHFWWPPANGKNGAAWATKEPRAYEVAFHVVSRGRRPRSEGDQRAMAAQARWIAFFRERGEPLANDDDGTAMLKPDEPYRPLPEEDFWDYLEREGITNPPRSLVELGALTFIRTARAGYRWSLRGAPILAYDPKSGRLVIVYAGKVIRPSSSAERREYSRTHWGKAPPRGVVRAGGAAPPPFARLEVAEVIAYTTRKGVDAELVDYVHKFGEGAPRGAVVLFPRLAFHRCRGGCRGTCAARGAVALVGGSYRVDTRGIVG